MKERMEIDRKRSSGGDLECRVQTDHAEAERGEEAEEAPVPGDHSKTRDIRQMSERALGAANLPAVTKISQSVRPEGKQSRSKRRGELRRA